MHTLLPKNYNFDFRHSRDISNVEYGIKVKYIRSVAQYKKNLAIVV